MNETDADGARVVKGRLEKTTLGEVSVYCCDYPVNSMWITGTITAKQKVRQKVPGLYAVCMVHFSLTRNVSYAVR